ncbi:hypothetical protein Glove_406g111 [Diversispora epigaea]|uniref:Uncharacterized protein n=1 Tax=Diversispora epigaea TaxID=1348612 RepID=A0A397H6K7_9GLOM|nr:hypothetical protein Glove_406g111 [Diversispora epigaea]
MIEEKLLYLRDPLEDGSHATLLDKNFKASEFNACNTYGMPRSKKIKLAAKAHFTKQKCNSLTEKFALDTDSDYISSIVVYSSESEDEDQLIERSNFLLPVKLMWIKMVEIPKKCAAYTGNSKSSFTKVAYSTLSITNFFSKAKTNIIDKNENNILSEDNNIFENYNDNNNSTNQIKKNKMDFDFCSFDQFSNYMYDYKNIDKNNNENNNDESNNNDDDKDNNGENDYVNNSEKDNYNDDGEGDDKDNSIVDYGENNYNNNNEGENNGKNNDKDNNN